LSKFGSEGVSVGRDLFDEGRKVPAEFIGVRLLGAVAALDQCLLPKKRSDANRLRFNAIRRKNQRNGNFMSFARFALFAERKLKNMIC
jgi:hypothetical protein